VLNMCEGRIYPPGGGERGGSLGEEAQRWPLLDDIDDAQSTHARRFWNGITLSKKKEWLGGLGQLYTAIQRWFSVFQSHS
jgi:hypothetical protein